MPESRHHARELRRRARWKRVGVVAIIVGVLAGLGGGVFAVFGGDIAAITRTFGPAASTDYTGSGTGSVAFKIKQGDYAGNIATNLRDSGVIKTRTAFLKAVASHTPAPVFQPGTYALKQQMRASAVLKVLLDPAAQETIAFTIPEGLRLAAIFSRMEKAGVSGTELHALAKDYSSLGLPSNAVSLEGYLFPATYSFDISTSAKQIVTAMIARTTASLDAAGVKTSDRNRVLTLASIIQKEARSTSDFYKVSRVLQNRIAAGMNLQLDSTVSYGVNGSTVTTTAAERGDASNEFNTYVHPGLPPGPIAAPGDTAIDAALNPADGSWLYFVAVNLKTGETVFSTTYAEHQVAVKQFQAWIQANPGWNGSN